MREYKHSSGPWYTGHLCRDDHSCNCPYILNDGYMGGIAEVYVDNEKRIVDGGNDAPPLEEAKANQRLISAATKMYSLLEKVENIDLFGYDDIYLDIKETLDFIDTGIIRE